MQAPEMSSYIPSHILLPQPSLVASSMATLEATLRQRNKKTGTQSSTV